MGWIVRGKLKVSSNVNLEGKKITVIAKRFDINLDKKTDMMTIKSEAQDIDASLYETGWVTFDSYVEVSLGIVSRYLGESKDYGDAVVTKDELTYSFEAVTQWITQYGVYTVGQTGYVTLVTGYAYVSGQTGYANNIKQYGVFAKGSISA